LLTEGYYTHYREKTAVRFCGLAELVRQKYDGDLNNLLKQSKSKSKDGDCDSVRSGVRDDIQEIKGIGGVALDIFCDPAQEV
jgi:hypothetical protein